MMHRHDVTSAAYTCSQAITAIAGVLPDEFNRQCDNPFSVAPFSSSDFRGNMKTFVLFHWKECKNERKECWKNRAHCLNARPVKGLFTALPPILWDNKDTSAESIMQQIVVKDFA